MHLCTVYLFRAALFYATFIRRIIPIIETYYIASIHRDQFCVW